MPRTALPPTPASSTDITGKDGTKQLATLQISFELPPPAIIPSNNSNISSSPTVSDPSGKNQYPMQASETVKSRRRSSAAQGPPKEQFALPPPPTRSRKIIQMKPREEPSTDAPASSSGKNASAAKAGQAAAASTTSGAKRKQPSATSAAGRKIARKTAHSLIERRRRSKMNEEFAVLKGMIPACTGEMHKLAILQASIEYVRYLEDCVAKLKAQREPETGPTGQQTPPGRERFSPEPYNPEHNYSGYRDEDEIDVEMTGSEQPSPVLPSNQSQSQRQSISPTILPEESRHRHESYSSTSTDHRHYSYSASATTSPAFGPQVYGYAQSNHSASASTLTSPALLPQRDLDQEATAALLMLNQTDRRGNNVGGRGMSVRDLLST